MAWGVWEALLEGGKKKGKWGLIAGQVSKGTIGRRREGCEKGFRPFFHPHPGFPNPSRRKE